MKTYPSIPGAGKTGTSDVQLSCIAFDKLDGSNLRFEWSHKQGWHKFGTRYRLFNHTDEEYGVAISIFNELYADEIVKVIRDNKDYRGVESVTVYCEFYGPNSIGGWHDFKDMTLMLFDVNVKKKGFVLPRDFVNNFGHLKIPSVIYEGKMSKEFVEDVRAGRYPVTLEGVVCKGINQGKKKSDQHGLWMRKVKTREWLQQVRNRAKTDEAFRKILQDNIKEQEDFNE